MSSAPLVEVRPEMYDISAPAAVPTILLDTRLGMQPEEVGFDFEAFYDLGRMAELNDDQISAYRHTFSAEPGKTGRMGLFKDDIGSTIYVPQCVKVAEKLPQILEKRSAQQRFGADIFRDATLPSILREVSVHELGHYVDAQTGDIKRVRRIERAKGCGALAVIAAGATDYIYNNISHAPLRESTFAAAAVIVSIAGELRQSKHADSAYERPAYDFQEKYGHIPIVQFSEAALARL